MSLHRMLLFDMYVSTFRYYPRCHLCYYRHHCYHGIIFINSRRFHWSISSYRRCDCYRCYTCKVSIFNIVMTAGIFACVVIIVLIDIIHVGFIDVIISFVITSHSLSSLSPLKPMSYKQLFHRCHCLNRSQLRFCCHRCERCHY